MTSKRVIAAPLAAVIAVMEGEMLPMENEPIMTLKNTIMTSPPVMRPSATSLGPYLEMVMNNYTLLQFLFYLFFIFLLYFEQQQFLTSAFSYLM